MKIAQRYLDEIEQICEGEDEVYDRLDDSVMGHWDNPTNYGGLFGHCWPLTEKDPFLDHNCGCLTQIRGPWGRVAFTEQLTVEIRNDERLSPCSKRILPSHLKTVTYPLTDSQKQEVRECLYPYAEWQTRLRLEFNDVPGIEAEIVEVGA